MTTWRKMLADEMSTFGETPDDIIASVSKSDDWLDVKFDDGYGQPEGPAFTAWTKGRVWFPCEHEGADYPYSAPRNPCDEVTAHAPFRTTSEADK